MALQTRHAAIGEVRGVGLMIGVDFEHSDDGHAPDGTSRDRRMQKCFESGLLLLSCRESTLPFCPPWIVTGEEAATAVGLFDAAVGASQ